MEDPEEQEVLVASVVVVLRSRVYDVISRHRANLFELRSLSLEIPLQVASVVVVVLRSRVYDVISRHRANLFELLTLSLQTVLMA